LAIGTIFEPRLGHGRREPRPSGAAFLWKVLRPKRRIVARKAQATRLQRVQNVNYTQSVYERVMQIATPSTSSPASQARPKPRS